MHKNKSLFQSFANAFSGIIHLVKYERNARIHSIATVIVLLSSIILELNITEWIFILIAISVVWISEFFNTALEKLFDLLEPRKNGYVKAGKDMAAAAVLISAILSVIIGLLILGPAILEKLIR